MLAIPSALQTQFVVIWGHNTHYYVSRKGKNILK